MLAAINPVEHGGSKKLFPRPAPGKNP